MQKDRLKNRIGAHAPQQLSGDSIQELYIIKSAIWNAYV